jgi:acetyl-CoA synthetase
VTETTRSPVPLIDHAPPDAPGTREIGFAVPARYNASAILFDNLAAGRGARPAVFGPAGRKTYADLCADAARYGHALRSLGLTPGERVLLFLDDTPAYPAALFGAMRAGFVPLLINTLTPPDLLQFYLQDSGARVAVTEKVFIDKFTATACADTKLETLIVVDGEASAGVPHR